MKWHVNYTVFLSIVHCYLSLVMVISGIVLCAFLLCVTCVYCFQLEHCLIVYCLCMFCFAVSGCQIVLECLLQDLSFCVCLTDPRGIAQL